MNNINTKHRAITALALFVYSHQLFAFDFGSSDKYSVTDGGWRIENETGRVSLCELSFEGGNYPRGFANCTPWTKALGKGQFSLAPLFNDYSGVMVIDNKTGKVAICHLGGGVICTPLSSGDSKGIK